MPGFHRSLNPYSVAPPPPASLPDYTIDPSTVVPLTNEEAGHFIDAFLQTQDGKILTLHRLADHLLGRTSKIVDDREDVLQLGDALEEERRRDAGVVQFQRDETPYRELTDDEVLSTTAQVDKKKSRKEERRLKKEKERQKRRLDVEGQRKPDSDDNNEKRVKKRKGEIAHKGHAGEKH
jgi:hypothetical protein